MIPDENRVLTSKPAARNTPSIGRLSGSTSAVNRLSPTSRPMAARCSSITVAMPRPWWASSTVNATSASSSCCHRSKRATATMSSPSIATSATRS